MTPSTASITGLRAAARETALRAAAARRRIALLAGGDRDRLLDAMADALDAQRDSILEANRKDLAGARAAGLSDAMIDRLALDEDRAAGMSEGVRQVARLPDPLARAPETIVRPNGLVIRKVRAPLGVVFVIYESRPNVTADAAAICFKAGNAVILRGGSEAEASNAAILEALASVAGLPEGALQALPAGGRDAVYALLEMDDLVDLVVPRGGEGLIRAVAERSRIPLLKHAKGVCHVYVDAAADLAMAEAIIENAKCQRPGVCNAAETLLVHEAVAARFLPAACARLAARGVEIRGDAATRALVPAANPAEERDWSEEYLDLILSVRVVPDLGAAIDHIDRYGTRHSDVIVTADPAAAARFTREVDSAAVYVNASSRFTDGGEFGMGAEIGISTDKLHARGPCGVAELTTYKYVIEGTGQIRT